MPGLVCNVYYGLLCKRNEKRAPTCILLSLEIFEKVGFPDLRVRPPRRSPVLPVFGYRRAGESTFFRVFRSCRPLLIAFNAIFHYSAARLIFIFSGRQPFY